MKIITMSVKRILSFSLLAGLILLSACKKSEDKAINISKDVFDVEDQRKIGQQLKVEIEHNTAEFNVLNKEENLEFYNYINALFQILPNTANVNYREDFNWTVTILKDDNLRTAFTVPGGHVFIYTGLLKFLTAENELMSIFAHEIAYADKEYAIYKLKDEYGSNLLGDILLGKTDTGVEEVAVSLKTLSYDMDQVAAADNYAIELLCPFQYDATGIKTVIENNSSTEAIEWLITRPSYANRVGNIVDQATNCGLEDPTYIERYSYFKSQLP